MGNRKWLGNGVIICAAASFCAVMLGAGLSQPADGGEQIKIGTVQNEWKASAPKASSDSRTKKKPFRIIEVIPHKACSMFPYLVEWGKEEEYDKNVPIGYEGLLWCSSHTGDVQMFSGKDVAADNSNPFVFIPSAIRRDYLSEYGTNLGNNKSGLWYRTTGGNQDIVSKNGYFEFVGEGKGTYYISASHMAEKPGETGIRYEVQAIPRKGGESPKGELYVSAPAYYFAKDLASYSKPDYLGKRIEGYTDYHYDLRFQEDALGEYRIEASKIRKKAAAGEKVSGSGAFDYFLTVKEGLEQKWQPGYSFFKLGNYGIQKAELSDTGTYVRIEDEKNMDGYEGENPGLGKGYFSLYREEDGVCPRYEVSFQKQGKGFYCANAPEDWKEENYSFTYMGSGKGQYDVAFLYGAERGETAYKAEITAVSHKQGRYALASTDGKADKTPIYKEKDGSKNPCDYAKIILNIDFKDSISWTPAVDSDNLRGVTLGGGDGGEASAESGGWVFHEIKDTSELETSRVSQLYKNIKGVNSNTEKYFKVGQRIYVKDQKRRVRYYCRDGFQNNEWFKLLCFSNNPKNENLPYSHTVEGVGYQFDKTPGENLVLPAAKELVQSFDSTYELEILQKTPGELTPEDVRSADLLYISDFQGVEGMAQSWKKISDARVALGKPALEGAGVSSDGSYPFTSDLRTDTLFAIYNECIYEKTVALMVNASVTRRKYPDVTITDNLDKLCFMMTWFQEAKNFARFMPGYSEYNSSYSTIDRENGKVSAYQCENTEHKHWGYYNFEHHGESPLNEWKGAFFTVVTEEGKTTVYPYDDSGQQSKDKVYEGESKYLSDYYGVKAFNKPGAVENIWKILHNRDRAEIFVEITNASFLGTVGQGKVIYADEFDPKSFDVEYRITVEGGSGSPLLDTKMFFDDNGNGIHDTGEKLWMIGSQEYAIPYKNNVRSAFTGGITQENAPLDYAQTSSKVIVQAEDSAGKTASAEAVLIIQEAFDLN